MKLKNKILSAIMIVAASMTLVSVSAFAASYSLNPAAVEVKAGETFTVELVTADVADICTIQFFATGTNETFTLTKVEDTALYADPMLSTSYAAEEYGLGWAPDGMWENGGVDASGVAAKLTYKVNDNVAPGSYTVQVTCDAANTLDYEENEIDFGTATATITVKGDELEAPSVSVDGKQEAYTDGSGNFTQGFLATTDVTGKAPISAITFNLTRTSDGATDTITATLPAKVESGTVKVAINIINVTSGVEITATGTAVKAVN